MSLAIKVHKIKRVLLIDGWHEIMDDTFIIDAFEIVEEGFEDDKKVYEVILKGGAIKEITSTGCGWIEKRASSGINREVYCPITSVLAISY
jgi:hypothetical protein